MTMKRIKGFISLLALATVVMGVTGCSLTDKNAKVKENLKAYLNTTYGEDFEVIDVNSYAPSTVSSSEKRYYGYAFPVNRTTNNPYSTFYFDTDLSCSVIEETYQVSLLSDSLNNFYQTKLPANEGFCVVTELGNDPNVSVAGAKMNYNTVLTMNIPYTLTIVHAVEGLGDINEEAAKYESVLKELNSNGFQGTLYVVCCKSEYANTLLQYYNHALPLDARIDSSQLIADASFDYSQGGGSIEMIANQFQADISR